ncbi:acyl-CoA N-acyltransferase [Ephemerocybe angulata]|uniref:Probable N-acetyltransferase 14 n=1 Tax=Ephemerocybe angulata TaxID=980116 RepID=A0A8H6I5Z6_9AGAR|nr:acyl-CoA N-acyltransferase [Tulosesus angulatus]
MSYGPKPDKHRQREAGNLIKIRFYENEDAEKVRDLVFGGFIRGELSPLQIGLRDIMKQPIVLPSYPIFVFGLFVLAQKDFRWSFATPCAIAAALCAASVSWILVWRRWLIGSFDDYCEYSLKHDMANIAEYYAHEKLGTEDDGGVSGFWVAVVSGRDGMERIVGCVGLDSRTQEDKTQSELRRMSVSEDYRRRGIAMELINTLVLHARKRGLKKVVLSTTSYQGSARSLYKKLGWVETGKVGLHWFMRNLDLYTLERTL